MLSNSALLEHRASQIKRTSPSIIKTQGLQDGSEKLEFLIPKKSNQAGSILGFGAHTLLASLLGSGAMMAIGAIISAIAKGFSLLAKWFIKGIKTALARALNALGKATGKAVEKAAAKTVVEKAAKKASTQAVQKAATGAATKTALRALPGVGLLVGLGFGVARAIEGDFTGAALEVAAGAASTVAGIGTAASLAAGAALVAHDIRRETDTVNKTQLKDFETTKSLELSAPDQVQKDVQIQTLANASSSVHTPAFEVSAISQNIMSARAQNWMPEQVPSVQVIQGPAQLPAQLDAANEPILRPLSTPQKATQVFVQDGVLAANYQAFAF